jgi:molecular chaperone HscB
MTQSGPDHFALFGLPRRFALDADALDVAYRRVQAQVHPDRFAAASAAERRVAVQWAARSNEALRILRSPARRAEYLCELNGVALGADSNTAMPVAFLEQQLQWREALGATGGARELAALVQQVESARQSLVDALAHAIDESRDFGHAATLVRQLMFVDKMTEELEQATAATAG